MKLNSIFAGNACFLVKYEDNEDNKTNFINFLENEGFRKTIGKYNCSHSNWLFINVNSMLYGSGPNKPVKLCETIVGEDPPNAFNVEEFKTIWNIIKKYKNNSESLKFIDDSMVSCGNSAFLVKDDIELMKHFWDYLKIHKFESLENFNYDWGWTLINVSSMLFTTNPKIISSYVGNLPSKAMNVSNFKDIWDIIIKHKDESWNIDNLIDDCEKEYKKEDYLKVLNSSEKLLELDKSNEKALEYKLYSLFNLKRYHDVLNIIDEAIKINPQNYKFYNLKAFIYTDLYRIDEAVDCFNKSFVLGGFDQEDTDVLDYRAKCYLRKAREEHYLGNDNHQALKSLTVYLKRYPEDKFALDLKQELTQNYAPFKYAEKLFYFERKAEELYQYGYMKESYECYKNHVLTASTEFKKNIPNIEFLGYDFVNRCTVYELENFKWYDEILLKSLEEFNGNYHEFFDKLYEISSDTIDVCLDKAKLYSKVYDDKLTVEYVKELLKKCPDNSELREFYDQIIFIQHVYEVADNSQEFKDYNTIEEYIEDVILCVVAHFPYYDEKSARKVVLESEDYIKEAYSKQWDASEVAWDFVILP